jgi:hypothetical protein
MKSLKAWLALSANGGRVGLFFFQFHLILRDVRDYERKVVCTCQI